MALIKSISKRLRGRLIRILSDGKEPTAQDPTADDPTLMPPPAYTLERANQIYGEAFRRCVEYLWGTGVVGDFLEFGTYRGYTARLLASLIQEFHLDSNLYLFDSFEGLPEIDSPIDQVSYEVAANRSWFRGQMNSPTGIADKVRAGIGRVLPESRFRVIKGYFEDTLDTNLPDRKAALIHLDCDLYSSTRQVLERIVSRGMLQDGCIIICDDYNCNRASPLMGERLALSQVFEEQQRFRYSSWFSYGWHGQTFFVHDCEHAVLCDGGSVSRDQPGEPLSKSLETSPLP